MNELVNIVVRKTGISRENAQKAVQATVGLLKNKLPGPLAGQLDSVLSGGALSGVTEQAGGLIRGKLSGAVAGQA
jgi:hypothetical protein